MKRKICVVVTARTSYTKIRPVLRAIKNHPALELQLICAGSALLNRYGEIDTQIQNDGFHVNERIYMIVEGENLLTSAKSTGLGLVEFSSAYERLKPDIVFVMADRYEQMAPAVSAAYMNIPLAHAQGGEVSGNIDEKVRHAITKLADYHFPATERARDWIVRMGENPDHVFLSGCPSIDLCKEVVESPDYNFKIYDKYGGVGGKPPIDGQFLIVMQHPVTTEYGSARMQAQSTIDAVGALKIPTIWFWPNIDAGSDETAKAIRVYREQHNPEHIHFFRNMEPQDFLRLLNNASAIIGNSSCALREASFLGTPAVNVGSRQAGRERAENVIDVSYDAVAIENAIRLHLGKPRPASSDLYGRGEAGLHIAEALARVKLTFSKTINYLGDQEHAQNMRVV